MMSFFDILSILSIFLRDPDIAEFATEYGLGFLLKLISHVREAEKIFPGHKRGKEKLDFVLKKMSYLGNANLQRLISVIVKIVNKLSRR